MLCEEFEDRLNAVLDERGRPECDTHLRLHADTCPECRHLALVYGALLDGFCALAAPEAPRDMAARVLAELPVRPSRASRTVLAGSALATAAALLVAIVPLMRVSPENGPQVASRNAKVASPDGALSDGALVASNLPIDDLPILQSLPGINGKPNGDVYTELAKETGNGLASIVLYLPGIGGTRGIIDADSSPVEDEANWAVRMSDGLRPVTDSVTETLNLLWKALPVTDPGQPVVAETHTIL